MSNYVVVELNKNLQTGRDLTPVIQWLRFYVSEPNIKWQSLETWDWSLFSYKNQVRFIDVNPELITLFALTWG